MLRKILLVLLTVGALLTAGCASETQRGTTPAAAAPSWAEGMPLVSPWRLPGQARETLRLIEAGGPFPHAKDGTVFGNYEQRLPRQRRGHYREYTVPTPGARDRGARRVVAGADGERYYTSDHYESFKAVVTR